MLFFGYGQHVIGAAHSPGTEAGPEEFAQHDFYAGGDGDSQQQAVEASEHAPGNGGKEDGGHIHVRGLALNPRRENIIIKELGDAQEEQRAADDPPPGPAYAIARLQEHESDGDGGGKPRGVGDDGEQTDDWPHNPRGGHAQKRVADGVEADHHGADGDAPADEAGDDNIHLLEEFKGAAFLTIWQQALPELQHAAVTGAEKEEEEAGEGQSEDKFANITKDTSEGCQGTAAGFKKIPADVRSVPLDVVAQNFQDSEEVAWFILLVEQTVVRRNEAFWEWCDGRRR